MIAAIIFFVTVVVLFFALRSSKKNNISLHEINAKKLPIDSEILSTDSSSRRIINEFKNVDRR